MNEEEQKRRIRNGSFWNAPMVMKKCDPNIKHEKWNPYENDEGELDFN